MARCWTQPSPTIFVAFIATIHLQSSQIKAFNSPRLWRTVKFDLRAAANANIFDGEFALFDGDLLYDPEVRRRQRLERLHRSNQNTQKEEREEKDDDNIDLHGTTFGSDLDEEVTSEQNNSEPLLLAIPDDTQIRSWESTAPAILFQSGPGTGKSSVLAARIAHLLRREVCQPHEMVVISFTNRDAAVLKSRALDMIYYQEDGSDENTQKLPSLGKEEMAQKIWCGTVHAFASAILRRYGSQTDTGDKSMASLRVISTKEMRTRVNMCFKSMLNPNHICDDGDDKSLRQFRLMYKEALDATNHNLGILIREVVRCMELWKEAAILPPPSFYSSPRFVESNFDSPEKDYEKQVRDDCIELAMRIGISSSAFNLALAIFPHYQTMHGAMGTADPSDLASLAFAFLLENPTPLASIRTKLKHIILDEYQDISSSQHALIRLIVRGRTDDDDTKCKERLLTPKGRTSEQAGKQSRSILDGAFPDASDHLVCYDVPNLFCAGDAGQSIYGWRGAAPSLTVDGFRLDYPQGIAISLGTSYRLPNHIFRVAHRFSNVQSHSESFAISPAGAWSASNVFLESDNAERWPDAPSNPLGAPCSPGDIVLGETLLGTEHESIFIRGLWDAREEAKYVASKIRKRSTERIHRCKVALKELSSNMGSSYKLAEYDDEMDIYDPTDVAVIVRSSSEMELIKESLLNGGIPFEIPDNESAEMHEHNNDCRSNGLDNKRTSSSKLPQTLKMKPVKLITMHRAKGDEFDDVYLMGWTEGVFPHPKSVASGRLEEERRLAFVALTRARQRIFITYSFVRRTAHYSPYYPGRKKLVTGQVKPSRFLKELFPRREEERQNNQRRRGMQKSPGEGVVWCKDTGIKEMIAGRDLPAHFRESYRTPSGYKTSEELQKRFSKESQNQLETTTDRQSSNSQKESTKTKEIQRENDLDTADAVQNQTIDCLAHIEIGLRDLSDGKRGSIKKYKQLFRNMLRDIFGIERGTALVLPTDHHHLQSHVDALVKVDPSLLQRLALSRCSAMQLGQYLAYMILTSGGVPINQ